MLSFRDEFGQWEPRAQRPEPWALYNGRIRRGEQIRVFPLSNWTELDVWRYIELEDLELPSIYFAHRRRVVERDGILLAVSECVRAARRRARRGGTVRYRTVGDLTVTGAVRSQARRHRDGDRRDRGRHRLRARRDPRRRPHVGGGDGGPQARGLLLMTAGDDATRELLRLATAGSVDDGKSTLIGRLLLDTELCSPTTSRPSRDDGGRPGPRRASPTACAPSASRASRSTSPTGSSRPTRRSFILADTPGPRALHAQHVHRRVQRPRRDPARRRPRAACVTQTRRHAQIATLLGIRALRRGVNKMDLVDFDQAALRRGRRSRSQASASRLRHRRSHVVPISALHGDNVVDAVRAHAVVRRAAAARVPGGRSTSPPTATPTRLRLPIQWVARPADGDARRYTGQLAAGTLRAGDAVVSLPAGATTTVTALDTLDPDGRGGRAAAVGVGRARRRHRRRPRRRARRARATRRPPPASSTRPSAG